jgi:glutamate-1-semialdehyde 2,1-aminomutase
MAGKESKSVAQDILERYRKRTKKSQAHDDSAKKYLPGGDTRTSTYYSPYPAYMEKGKGCYLFDCDGNQYIDFLNNYTSLIHGHADPDILKAAQAQLEMGTVLGSPSVVQYKHAEILCKRIPSVDMVRYCNSGTEATLFVIRAARAFTQKDIIIKMDGGYHGSHDCAEVNVRPDVEAKGLPRPHLEGKGVPAGVLNDVLVTIFNDLESTETLLKKYGERVAGIILEPMLGALGMIPPRPNFLKGIRELADKYRVLLIFDEVMTFRLSLGGLQARSGVKPDLTSLAKIIGGGFPVGAFGGRKEIMERFDPAHPETLMHSGTFNGNNITMAAGIAALEKYDQAAVDKVNRLGDRLREGFNRGFKKAGLKGQATGIGSLVQVHWRDGEIVTAKDSAKGRGAAGELLNLFHFEMLNRGIFFAPRGMFSISTPMIENEVDKAIGEFESTLGMLKPYLAEVRPSLIQT